MNWVDICKFGGRLSFGSPAAPDEKFDAATPTVQDSEQYSRLSQSKTAVTSPEASNPILGMRQSAWPIVFAHRVAGSYISWAVAIGCLKKSSSGGKSHGSREYRKRHGPPSLRASRCLWS